MSGTYLGPEYSSQAIEDMLKDHHAAYVLCEEENLFDTVAGFIERGDVVGWFQGRMEFGPRALGSRSIVADPRNPEMQKKINLKIKFREGFRPFAPAVKIENVSTYFKNATPSPYMLFVDQVNETHKKILPEDYNSYSMEQKLEFVKSSLPAVTHADGSARVQTVDKEINAKFWKLLHAFENRTGCGVLVNTSFNVRGEPIVCTPADALRCFMNTDMDVLVLNDFIVQKREQTNMRSMKYKDIMND